MVVTAKDTALKHTGATLTVAVCTRDRTSQLARLLDVLAGQRRPLVEVLVVDNAPSSSDTQQMVAVNYPSFRYVREPIPGLDFARNRALRTATGKIVAFIDDDAIPASDWAESIMRVFSEGERIAVCTGQVTAMSLESEAERLFEANGGLHRGDVRIHLPPGAGRWPRKGLRPLITWATAAGVGCSLAIRTRVAIALGGFDVALDQGPALAGGGDIDMLWRVLEAGHEIVYEPRVRVWHEHRKDLEAVESQILGHDRAFMAALAKGLCSAPLHYKPSIAAFIAWRLLKPLWRLSKRTLGRDPLPFRTLARSLFATWRGVTTYPAARQLALAKQREFGRV